MIKILILSVIICCGFSLPSLSQPRNFECPGDLEILTPLLLRDVPNYANRVIQRSRAIEKSVDLKRSILFAGRGEYEPIHLVDSQQFSGIKNQTQAAKQLFFTTLERQFVNQKPLEIQNYHWLFLTKTPEGWSLVMSLTRFGTKDKTQPPSPPRDTTNGVIGQAVKLWLRDCRAGSIKP